MYPSARPVCRSPHRRPIREVDMIDGTDCPDAERIQRKVSGQPIAKGVRILVDDVIVNAARGISPEEIAGEISPGFGVERA